MSKLKLFLENFLIYGVGGTIGKIIPLIMVPIVTRLMPDSSYFGISDLSNTLISLCSAIAVMGMYDAMYRMFFDKDDLEFKKDVCSTALIFTLIVSAVVFIVMFLLRNVIASFMFEDEKYINIVFISAIAVLVSATNSIVSAPTRMQNKRGTYLVMNTISPLLSYAIAIPLLLAGYYIIALPLAVLISGATSELIFLILNRRWFSFKRFKKGFLKPLLIIAIPLLPNFLIYWVFNSSDRLMITKLIGLEASGIYAVSAKLGSISQLIYIAFSGGWQYFAFSTMKEDNQVKSNSLVFEYLGVISFVFTFFVFALSYPIFKILFEVEYLSGYIAAPYLFLAPLLQMLFQVAANQFIVVKKTWPNFFILSSGAVVNIVLNLILIPVLGIEGAAIATLVGYLISDIICVIVLIKMKLMVVSTRFILSVFTMAIFVVVWRLFITSNILFSMLLALGATAIILLLYYKDIKALFGKFRKRKNKEAEQNDI